MSVPQICIRYCLDLDLLPLPKTVTPDPMRGNSAADFKLHGDDVEALRKINARDYGEAAKFPEFGGLEQDLPPVSVNCMPGDRSPKDRL